MSVDPLVTSDALVTSLSGSVVASLADLERSAGADHSFLQTVIETTPECMKVVAPDGELLLMNPAGLRMVGALEFSQISDTPIFDLIAPEHREAWILNHEAVCRGERLSWTFDILGLTGERRHLETQATPIRLPTGEVGQLAITRDVTAAVRGEQALRQSESRARAMLDALPAAVYTTDAEGRVTYFNEAAVRFSGRTPVIGSDSWCVSWKLYWPNGTPMPHDACPMALAMKRQSPSHGEYEAVAERPDGVRVPFIPYATPLFGEDGALTGGINMLVDITERKAAIERQQLMINELNHRVKNTLSVVQSLAHLTLRNDTSAEGLGNFEARLQAMSAAHDVLTARSWEGAQLGELVKKALDPLCVLPGRYTATGPDVDLPARPAVALSMALHELCTNAIKHGSLSVPAGKIDVSWRYEAEQLSLTWREHGGPPVSPPVRRGFGMQMLKRALTHEFGGSVTLDFEPEGLRCHIVGRLASP